MSSLGETATRKEQVFDQANDQQGTPKGVQSKGPGRPWDDGLIYHKALLAASDDHQAQDLHFEEFRMSPLFSAAAADRIADAVPSGNAFPQFGLLAQTLEIYDASDPADRSSSPNTAGNSDDGKRIFLNVNTPWSAFICGSQGSGKSHTLSCMLENALIPCFLGKLPKPLAGIVFHYDKFSGLKSAQICEAATLCKAGIPIRVLVSPSNFWNMERLYSGMPGLIVKPLLLKETQLNMERVLKLMAVNNNDKSLPLYMEVMRRILREMAMESRGQPGLDFEKFRRQLAAETFNDQQKILLQLRIDILESFMELPNRLGALYGQDPKPDFPDTKKGRAKERKWQQEQSEKIQQNKEQNIWSFEPGSLTIVDLSCPFVDEAAACAMFNMCLTLFLESESRHEVGRIVALDEAHKFMTESDAASSFTETLLAVIRQQRHLATRVIIATQEPTISPKLIDLSSMTIVHRFTSPSWLQALKAHLAGISDTSDRDVNEIFELIVNLQAGEALLFSPTAILDVRDGSRADRSLRAKVQKLGMRYVKMRVRKRVTKDGGRSIMAV